MEVLAGQSSIPYTIYTAFCISARTAPHFANSCFQMLAFADQTGTLSSNNSLSIQGMFFFSGWEPFLSEISGQIYNRTYEIIKIPILLLFSFRWVFIKRSLQASGILWKRRQKDCKNQKLCVNPKHYNPQFLLPMSLIPTHDFQRVHVYISVGPKCYSVHALLFDSFKV